MAKTRREQLEELMSAASDDQVQAMKEAVIYLASPEVVAFENKIKEFRERTLPGSHFDQILTGFSGVVDNLRLMALQGSKTTAEREAEIAEQQAAAAQPKPAE